MNLHSDVKRKRKQSVNSLVPPFFAPNCHPLGQSDLIQLLGRSVALHPDCYKMASHCSSANIILYARTELKLYEAVGNWALTMTIDHSTYFKQIGRVKMVKRMRLLASAGTFLAAIEYKAAANSLSIVPQFREKYSGLMTKKILSSS